jgi:hypothetical protein
MASDCDLAVDWQSLPFFALWFKVSTYERPSVVKRQTLPLLALSCPSLAIIQHLD